MRVLLALLLLALPGAARASSIGVPDYTVIQQGTNSQGAIVSCATTSTELLNCPLNIGASDLWRVVTCTNDGSNKVYICPHLCSGCTTSSGSFIALPAGASFTFGGSARHLSLSCVASGSASQVRCYVEK